MKKSLLGVAFLCISLFSSISIFDFVFYIINATGSTNQFVTYVLYIAKISISVLSLIISLMYFKQIDVHKRFTALLTVTAIAFFFLLPNFFLSYYLLLSVLLSV